MNHVRTIANTAVFRSDNDVMLVASALSMVNSVVAVDVVTRDVVLGTATSCDAVRLPVVVRLVSELCMYVRRVDKEMRPRR